jgi:hypothetical protein
MRARCCDSADWLAPLDEQAQHQQPVLVTDDAQQCRRAGRALLHEFPVGSCGHRRSLLRKI